MITAKDARTVAAIPSSHDSSTMLRITPDSSDSESREESDEDDFEERKGKQVIGSETVLQPSAMRTINRRE